jgi:hypothetical protein
MDEKLRTRWIDEVGEAKTRADLDGTVDAWLVELRVSSMPQGSLGFEFYMMSRQWDSAKSSLIRSHGRSAGQYGYLLDFLTAVVARKRVLR